MDAKSVVPLLAVCLVTCGTKGEDTPVLSASTTEAGYAPVNGGELYYEVTGVGGAVVLIHGNGEDLRSWDDQVSALAGTFRVIAYDVRGFGKSSLPTEGQPYSHHDDLRMLLRHLNVSGAHIVGLSMGAGIAVDFVLANPEMSRSLVTAGPWVSGHSSAAADEIFAGFGQVAEALASGGTGAALEAWFGAPYVKDSFSDTVVLRRMREIGSRYTFWHFAHRDPNVPLDPPAVQRLEEISVPVLLILGERDITACREVGELLQRTVPGARTVEIAGAGHISNIEKPVEFNRSVLDFLTTVESGS